MSSGEILGWLSSDDAYYDSGVVSAVVEAFVSHQAAALVYGHAVLINSVGLQLHAEWMPPTRMLGRKPPSHLSQPAVFVRRSAVGDRLVDESYDVAMDTELWLRLAGNHPLVRLDRILAAERHHPERKSYTMSATAAEEGRRLGGVWRSGSGWIAHARDKAGRVACRLIGVTLVPRIVPRPNGFDGRLDSRVALALRQLAVPRSRLPLGFDKRR
jgi:hypothetical protein